MVENDSNHRILFFWITILLFVVISCDLFVPILAHSSVDDGSGSWPFSSHRQNKDVHNHHHGGCDHDHSHRESDVRQSRMLPEELAEEEDLRLESDVGDHHDDDHHYNHQHADSDLFGLGLWARAMGCSLLVSMASLICLILLPVLFLKGKPSKMVVDALATFGAGAMLGDSFLHQLPHAFSLGHSHSHNHDGHDDHDEISDAHSHSIQDLSVGLSVLFGIVLFFLVEKVVRYVEEATRKGGNSWGHGHHHHKSHRNLKDQGTNGSTTSTIATSEGKSGDKSRKKKKKKNSEVLQKIVSVTNPADAKELDVSINNYLEKKVSLNNTVNSPSNLIFGYLNLFSDGVHNFTDGMALGSAFLVHGSVGGWSRTLFLLAHELPQEIGDFGILVHSGFTVPKALFFNFLSALVALLGTALALLLGKDPGYSSLIEGFTAGGFIYISVAGVLPEMNNGSTSPKNTFMQLISLILGMGVALCISLAE